MRKTKEFDSMCKERVAVDTIGLQSLLSCGRVSAVKIGEAAGAKIQAPSRRVLWNVDRVRKYLETISE